MRIDVLTMFPALFNDFLASPVISRAVRKGAAEICLTDIKDHAAGSFRKIDDSPYGGGPGCILRCEPVIAALETVRTEDVHVILFSPAGKTYDQQDARRLSRIEHLVLICGHYEGLDERIIPYADEQLSLGDFILTGGEIPAMAVMDSVIRLFPESLKPEASGEESFENGLLEYPQYTHPAEFRGACVPEVLLSGNHEAIASWRLKEALRKTKKLRPDLLKDRILTEEEQRMLKEIGEEEDRKSVV